MILMLIPPPLYDFSQPDFHLTHPSLIYICHASHIVSKSLQAYNIEDTVIPEKEHKNQEACQVLVIVLHLNEFDTIPSQIFTTYNS